MRNLKALLTVTLSVLALMLLLATNAIASVAQVFCFVSVAVFVGASLFGLALKLRA
ncbi:MAG TPA: hypothetical protein VGF61_25075 [Candidatus Acidoferrum sp.]|jgi:hypothetical protein